MSRNLTWIAPWKEGGSRHSPLTVFTIIQNNDPLGDLISSWLMLVNVGTRTLRSLKFDYSEGAAFMIISQFSHDFRFEYEVICCTGFHNSKIFIHPIVQLTNDLMKYLHHSKWVSGAYLWHIRGTVQLLYVHRMSRHCSSYLTRGSPSMHIFVHSN